jgi:hypothetical protein
MFRLLAIASTLLPMLSHSIFGCCWHHAHTMVSIASVAAEVDQLDCSGHGECESHGHASHDLPAEIGVNQEIPGHPEVPCCPGESKSPCGEDQCVFVGSELVQVELFGLERLLDHERCSTHEPVLSCTSPDVQWLLSGNATTGAQSPRALTQVWLI